MRGYCKPLERIVAQVPCCLTLIRAVLSQNALPTTQNWYPNLILLFNTVQRAFSGPGVFP